MITASKYNMINFSSDFNRKEKTFNANLQRRESLISETDSMISFLYEVVEPESIPVATLYLVNKAGAVTFSYISETPIELDNGILYFFSISNFNENIDHCYLIIEGVGIVYSEKIKYIDADLLKDENIIEIEAYNANYNYGFVSAETPAGGFFEVSKINNKVFGNSKIEYNYTFGRKIILRSENYIKTRFTFQHLSMYQQNLLKFLCNCETLKIDGVEFCLVSDFTEINKNPENEKCDLQAEFVKVENVFFEECATEIAEDINVDNLFTT